MIFLDINIESETDRIYKKIKSRKNNEITIYTHEELNYNKILKRVEKQFWFTKLYYYDMGLILEKTRKFEIVIESPWQRIRNFIFCT